MCKNLNFVSVGYWAKNALAYIYEQLKGQKAEATFGSFM